MSNFLKPDTLFYEVSFRRNSWYGFAGILEGAKKLWEDDGIETIEESWTSHQLITLFSVEGKRLQSLKFHISELRIMEAIWSGDVRRKKEQLRKNPYVRRLCWKWFNVVVIHGGGATGVTQVNDTDLHQHLRKVLFFLEKETVLVCRWPVTHTHAPVALLGRDSTTKDSVSGIDRNHRLGQTHSPLLPASSLWIPIFTDNQANAFSMMAGPGQEVAKLGNPLRTDDDPVPVRDYAMALLHQKGIYPMGWRSHSHGLYGLWRVQANFH